MLFHRLADLVVSFVDDDLDDTFCEHALRVK